MNNREKSDWIALAAAVIRLGTAILVIAVHVAAGETRRSSYDEPVVVGTRSCYMAGLPETGG